MYRCANKGLHDIMSDIESEIRLHWLSFFLSRYCTTPSRGLRAGGLRLKATVQKVYGKRKDKDDRVKKNIQEELKEG